MLIKFINSSFKQLSRTNAGTVGKGVLQFAELVRVRGRNPLKNTSHLLGRSGCKPRKNRENQKAACSSGESRLCAFNYR